jgi:hypothetical protein
MNVDGIPIKLRSLVRRVLPRPRSVETRCEWSIGIYFGRSPTMLHPLESVHNPVLTRKDVTDVPAGFIADPFMIRRESTWYMFFEVKNRASRKGEIGLATSSDGMRWSYQQIVLAEPFHLSYPYVFEWMGDYYMIPESQQSGSVRLYKAVNFPTDWSLDATLLDDIDAVDSSVFRFRDTWWLLTGSGIPPNRADNLHLFYADNLRGPWQEHPASPVVRGDACGARPAGRPLVFNNSIVRYSQDCYPAYGTQVRAFEIVELTRATYRERETDANPVLRGPGSGWNGSGMHHVDAHLLADGRWIACVDGWVSVPV